MWNPLPPQKAATSTSGSDLELMTEVDNEAIFNLDNRRPLFTKYCVA